jgi:hypothetical protein
MTLSQFEEKLNSILLKKTLAFHNDLARFNKIVSLFIELAFAHEFNSADTKKLAFEIYRALGSLLYQNGSKLSEANLTRLLVRNNKSPVNDSSLLTRLRANVELELDAHISKNTTASDVNVELLNKLDLISTQLVFNLTIPSIATTVSGLASNSPATDTNSFVYIDEKYKAQCGHLAMRVLRFHHMNKKFASAADTSSILKHDDYKVNKSKILSKALQALENLFNSIKTSNLPQTELNWLKIDSTDQIGDILAIIKVTRFFLKLE